MTIGQIDIREAITDREAYVLVSLGRSIEKQNAIFVGVGIWKGHSASLMGERAKELNGHLYCIDHWEGNVGTSNVAEAQDKDIYGIFEHNMKELKLWDYIITLKMDSLTASKQFLDNSIDFLFLDADHRYEPFKQDLEAWMPKMKMGGIICGHDCEVRYSTSHPALRERLDRNLDKDCDGNYHTGVIKGLNDYFGDDYIISPGSRIWFRKI